MMVEYPKYGNNNRLPETIVVFPDLEIASLFGGEHVELTGDYETEVGADRMLVRYWPDEDWLVFTWPNRPMDVREGGVMEDQFNALYGYLTAKYPRFGRKTKVDWMSGVDDPRTIGNEIFEGKHTPKVIAQQSIQGYYPSGKPIRFGDRRPVSVRGHRRRA